MEEVCAALAASTSPDKHTREQAETFLSSYNKNYQFQSVLLEIVRNESVDLAVRSSASIMLKNEVRAWEDVTDQTPEQIRVREEMFPTFVALVKSDQSTLWKQILECIRLLLFTEFPEKWVSLVPAVSYELNSTHKNEIKGLRAALEVLRKLAFRYEVTFTQRSLLSDVIFPQYVRLIEIGKLALQQGLEKEEAAILLKLICKCYFSCISLSIPKHVVFMESFNTFMQLLDDIINYKLPKTEDTNKPQFKCKKWTLEIVYRFFTRTVPQDGYEDANEHVRTISDMYSSSWAPRHLQSCLILITQDVIGSRCESRRCTSKAVQIIAQGVETGRLFNKQIKPEIDFILTRLSFPMLCSWQDDVDTACNNPIEYIRNSTEGAASVHDCRGPVSDLIVVLARLRGKEVLEKIANVVTEKLVSTDGREVYGALSLLGLVASRLSKKKRGLSMEEYLMKQVYPLLSIEGDFLIRGRAIWCLEQFLENRKMWKSIQNVMYIYEAIGSRLGDSYISVRLQAGASLKVFFSFKAAELQNRIIEDVPKLMRSLFAILSEMDCELVINTIEEMVTVYEKQTAPFALDVTKFLSAALLRSLNEDSENNSDELSWNALSTLQAIKTVLSTASPSVFSEAFDALQPMLDKLGEPDQLEYLDDYLDLITYISQGHPAPLPIGIWKYIQQMHLAVCGVEKLGETNDPSYTSGWCSDCIDAMLPPISNILVKDGERNDIAENVMINKLCVRTDADENNLFFYHLNIVASKNITYADLLYLIAEKTIQEELSSGLELLCLLYGSYARWQCLNFRFGLDLVMHVLKEQTEDLSRDNKQMLLRTFATLLFYSPEMFLSHCESHNVTTQIFEFLFSHADTCVRSIHEKKIFVLAMSKLIPLLYNSPVFSNVARHLVLQCTQLYDLRQKHAQQESSDDDQDDDADNDDDSEQELDDEQDAVETRTRSLLKKLENTQDLDEESDDESYSARDCSEFILEPFENVNEFSFVASVIGGLQPQARAVLLQTLGDADYSLFESHLCEASKIAITSA